MKQMFRLMALGLANVFEIHPTVARDERGSFVKTVHRAVFSGLGLQADFSEEYYTVSGVNVLRGMHFQVPPHEQAKLVYCLSGKVLDVVVDLRRNTADYQHFVTLELSAGRANMIYIPPGCAHGFLALEAPATLVYHVTSEHCPESDKGIRWDSFGFAWPTASPILSPRDRALPGLHDFGSPFLGTGQ